MIFARTPSGKPSDVTAGQSPAPSSAIVTRSPGCGHPTTAESSSRWPARSPDTNQERPGRHVASGRPPHAPASTTPVALSTSEPAATGAVRRLAGRTWTGYGQVDGLVNVSRTRRPSCLEVRNPVCNFVKVRSSQRCARSRLHLGKCLRLGRRQSRPFVPSRSSREAPAWCSVTRLAPPLSPRRALAVGYDTTRRVGTSIWPPVGPRPGHQRGLFHGHGQRRPQWNIRVAFTSRDDGLAAEGLLNGDARIGAVPHVPHVLSGATVEDVVEARAPKGVVASRTRERGSSRAPRL